MVNMCKEILYTYARLEELKWPTKNFLDNTLSMEVKEVSRKNFIENIDYELLDKVSDLMNYQTFHFYSSDCSLQRDLVRLSAYKTAFLDDKIIDELVNSNPLIYNRKGLLNIIDATNYYLATVIFENAKSPVIIDSDHQFLSTMMGLIINKIGIDRFVKEYFNNDYRCFTRDIALTLGTKLTRELYKYAQNDNKTINESDILLDKLINISDETYKYVLRDLRIMAGRSLEYQKEHRGENDTYKIIVPQEKKKVKLLDRINPFKK